MLKEQEAGTKTADVCRKHEHASAKPNVFLSPFSTGPAARPSRFRELQRGGPANAG